jgi:pimeloyl-ACP methyl ester carboxylesterase
MFRLPENVRRRFADIDIGQMHYYTAGEGRSERPPTCLMGPSPWSAKWLAPMVADLGQTRWTIAPDTLGQGDSCPPPEGVDIPYLADATVKMLDAIDVPRCDVFGMHTGGHIAMEMAIRHPDRVRRLVLEGIGIPPQAIKDEYTAQILDTPKPDAYGSHFMWAFNMNRDMFLFFPYYRKELAHRRSREIPPVDELHERAVELLKTIETYHHAYIAAWANNAGGCRFPEIPVPTMLTLAAPDTAETDMADVAAMIPDCVVRHTAPGSKSGDMSALTPVMLEFLDAD